MNEVNLKTGIENRTDRRASFWNRFWNDSSDQIGHARMIFDEDGNPADYIFLDINPALEKVLGLSRDQVSGKGFAELFPQHDPGWIRKCGEVVRSGPGLSGT